MKVLIVGGGGREHALAWKSAQSPLVDEVLVAPGNAGTAVEPHVRNVAIAGDDLEGLVALARRESVALTIVGPEQPLVDGITDRFEAAGLAIFGPRAAAAQLEGSKSFAKEFLVRHNIPTARYGRFTDVAAALRYLDDHGAPIVVKADGLAAGKGVVVAGTLEEAQDAVRSMLADNAFGDAGSAVVIEECLTGEEASFIAMVDGTDVLPLASSQDHKARDDGDLGPNTGGMGAYSPAPVITSSLHQRIMDDVIKPTVTGLAAEGLQFRGFLYAGLMIGSDGTPRVLEFNCRMGDPETQPILMRLSSDIVEHCLAAVESRLGQQTAHWDERAAVGVVLASGGYPGRYSSGHPIAGLGSVPDVDFKVFHAGTRLDGDQILTSGGRVLCAVGLGTSVLAARDHAYAGLQKIHWDGSFYRNDIGYRAIAREQSRN